MDISCLSIQVRTTMLLDNRYAVSIGVVIQKPTRDGYHLSIRAKPRWTTQVIYRMSTLDAKGISSLDRNSVPTQVSRLKSTLEVERLSTVDSNIIPTLVITHLPGVDPLPLSTIVSHASTPVDLPLTSPLVKLSLT